MFKYKFQHYVDISTSAESVTMLKIQAGGEYAMQRMKHLWGAFKYVKMGRVSVKFLPASTLPVDPLGLSYGETDPQTVDPRDQMNPGLVRITNGEPVFDDLGSLSAGEQEQMYINTMLDPRWSKFMLQRGFSRSAVPLYWNIGQLSQDVYPGHVQNLPALDTAGQFVDDTTCRQIFDGLPNGSDGVFTTVQSHFLKHDSGGTGLFQVGHKGRMGWMPTDAFQHFHNSNGDDMAIPLAHPLPAINVITAILPKAFKTIYYYRMFITETFYFSGIKNTGLAFELDGVSREIRAFDNFMQVKAPFPKLPNQTDQPMNGDGNPIFGLPRTKNDGDMTD